jgi:hypothetical protein
LINRSHRLSSFDTQAFSTPQWIMRHEVARHFEDVEHKIALLDMAQALVETG